ncbi:MAG: hypothetical protein ACRD1H_12275 [Vicinamibacterales bacterium]
MFGRSQSMRGVISVITAVLLAAVLVISDGCALLPANKRALNVLKNRTSIPAESDFDDRVTLENVLQPGDDTTRWSSTRAAEVTGYVIVVKQAGIESANRFSFTRRDLHIEIALHRDAPPRERVILEVTPPMRDWAKTRGIDWSAETLQRTLVGRRCRFAGWLLFDTEHVDDSENTNPGGERNWRATAWEIHPVTMIAIE